jgi:hypothetical protein
MYLGSHDLHRLAAMDQEILVEPWTDDGRRIISQLLQDGFEVTVAFWVHSSEESPWEFYIASPTVDRARIGEAIGRLYASMRKISDLKIGLSQVTLVPPTDSIATEALALRDRQPWRGAIRYRAPKLGNLPMAEAYIYPRQVRSAEEFSPDDIEKALAEAEQMVKLGFVRPAVITAWSGLEAAMRLRLRAAGQSAGWDTQPRLLINQLFSAGILAPDELRSLDGLTQLRNQIAHGFSAPTCDPTEIQFLIVLARRLLADSKAMRKSA